MTLEEPGFSIVIPLYNEEACVGRSVREIAEALERAFPNRHELILVINGSTDGTGAICEALARECPGICLVRASRNLGYGGGILRGLAEARAIYCGFMCGDGQVPTDVLIRLMREMARGQHDLVKNQRIRRGDGWLRKTQSVVYNHLFRLAFDIRCRDINAMPKLMRREVYQQLALESTDWFIDAEIMIKAEHAGLRILEVPTAYLKRIGGTSGVRVSTIFEFLSNAARIIRSGKLAAWKQTRCVAPAESLAAAQPHQG